MLSFTLYPSEYGMGYQILRDNVVILQQDFMPGAPGFQGMTSDEATAAANAAIASLTPAAA